MPFELVPSYILPYKKRTYPQVVINRHHPQLHHKDTFRNSCYQKQLYNDKSNHIIYFLIIYHPQTPIIYQTNFTVAMLFRLSSFAATLALFSAANAACQLKNGLNAPINAPETRTQLCMPQPSGDWTFAMDTSTLNVPTFNAGTPYSGLVSTFAFIIYDNNCHPQGIFAPAGNDCGTPYHIQESWMPWTLVITDINKNPGGAMFSFKYAAGKYTTNNNHCGCESIGSGLRAEDGCKCAFLVQGQ